MPESSPQPTSLSGQPRQVIGFVLNPIAGMGGRVGLKGTDGPEVLEEALKRGAKAKAHERALQGLKLLARHPLWKEEAPPLWLTSGGSMGVQPLKAAGYGGDLHRLIYFPSETAQADLDPATGDLIVASKQKEASEKKAVHSDGAGTSADDTRLAVKAMVKEGASLIVFCGGDGTARDVLNALAECEKEGLGIFGGGGPEEPSSDSQTPSIPVVGIPAGVKMHSAVFGMSPSASADLIELYLTGRAGLREAEVMDVDEQAFRDNRLAVKLHGHLRVPYHADLLQGCKCLFGGEDEQEALEGIVENMEELKEKAPEGTLWLLGPGSTVALVKAAFGVEEPTMLGVDALEPDGTAHKDIEEQTILKLIEAHPEARVVVSPIGAQGFLFGRGNQQFSPSVLASVGKDNLQVVASPHKLRDTPKLLLDTGRPELDKALSGFYKVMIGFNASRMTQVEAAG